MISKVTLIYSFWWMREVVYFSRIRTVKCLEDSVRWSQQIFIPCYCKIYSFGGYANSTCSSSARYETKNFENIRGQRATWTLINLYALGSKLRMKLPKYYCWHFLDVFKLTHDCYQSFHWIVVGVYVKLLFILERVITITPFQ